MGYHLVPRVRELIDGEAALDVAAGRPTVSPQLRALVKDADAATLQRAAAAQGCENLLHNLYLRAVCLQAIAEQSPLLELFPYSKSAMGTYRDAHQLLKQLRAGDSTGLAPGMSVKIAFAAHEDAAPEDGRDDCR